MQLQINPVNHVANLLSFFMRLTGICNCQTNICMFTTLHHFCPHVFYLTLLISVSLTPNIDISRTVGYKSGSRCSENLLVLVF